MDSEQEEISPEIAMVRVAAASEGMAVMTAGLEQVVAVS
jgi:hypothetical protein